MGKILATDLDGTLFYPAPVKTIIPKKNTTFLRKWIDEGNKVVLVTSRSRQFVEGLMKEIDRPCDYMACTGAQIFSNNQIIREVTLDNQRLKEVLDKVNENYGPTAYLMTTEEYPCLIKSLKNTGKFLFAFYKLWHKLQHKRAEPFIFDNKLFDNQIKEGKIFKVMIFFGLGMGKKKFTKELNKVFREQYQEMEFSWSRKVNEITPYDCNKGSSLEIYCEKNHIDKDDVIVVGDSGNDISMFTKFHEQSYCMRKAYTSVRKYAKYTIGKVYKLDNVLKGEEK